MKNYDDALSDLNLVKERRYSDYEEGTESGAALEKEIQLQRRLELAFEGHRFFDVRRWMIADKDGEGRQNGYAHGMNVRGTINDTEEFNRVVETEKIVFNRKMYLQPIPDHEMRKTQNLVQNPGW